MGDLFVSVPLPESFFSNLDCYTCFLYSQEPSEVAKRFWAWLWRHVPARIEPNSLPILMRAVNAVMLRVPIRQPCWRAGRWGSLT